MTTSALPAPPITALRQDLELLRAAPSARGEPGFVLADPVRHRYFRLSQHAAALLSHWRLRDPAAIGSAAARSLGEPVEEAEVHDLAAFLEAHHLAECGAGDGWRQRLAYAERSHSGLLARAIHGYLFFRIPLFRPQRFLDALWPWAAPLFSRGFATICAVLAFIALLALARQWDLFIHTFVSFLTVEGIVAYGVSLVAVKSLHELGHALMARKYGVRVATIGVAFLVLFPVLYTETSPAWRLDRRKRMMIGTAGMFVEIVIAVLATLAWFFLPDGTVRSAAFATATVGWTMSLAVNLNPLMRFDGYYLLSDLLGVENLQPRAFARARWRLREALFGFGDPPPEVFAQPRATLLLVYSLATWIYRFFLFVGIALLVYHFFIKPVAIVLFAIEIGWFIVRPVWHELRVWRHRRGDIVPNRQLARTALVLSMLGLVLFVPWQTSIQAPGLLQAAQITPVHATAPARIRAVHVTEGQPVHAGDILFELEMPDAIHELHVADAELAQSRTRLARLAADADTRSQRTVLEGEVRAAADRIAALRALEAERELRAPHAGTAVNVDARLRPGMWIAPSRRLAAVAASGAAVIEAYVSEADLARMSQGAMATFTPEEPEVAVVAARLVQTAQLDARTLSVPALADIHGGAVGVQPRHDGSLEPHGSWYHAIFEVTGSPAPTHVMRGTLHVEAEARSIAGRIARRVAGVLIRESGF